MSERGEGRATVGRSRDFRVPLEWVAGGLRCHSQELARALEESGETTLELAVSAERARGIKLHGFVAVEDSAAGTVRVSPFIHWSWGLAQDAGVQLRRWSPTASAGAAA